MLTSVLESKQTKDTLYFKKKYTLKKEQQYLLLWPLNRLQSNTLGLFFFFFLQDLTAADPISDTIDCSVNFIWKYFEGSRSTQQLFIRDLLQTLLGHTLGEILLLSMPRQPMALMVIYRWKSPVPRYPAAHTSATHTTPEACEDRTVL